jgi:hypothetical protein
MVKDWLDISHNILSFIFGQPKGTLQFFQESLQDHQRLAKTWTLNRDPLESWGFLLSSLEIVFKAMGAVRWNAAQTQHGRSALN